ncbi:MAG: ABC transporter permease [Labrys sp. (in: a-proteobacteria)]|jgi:spermidine/putrescine transport system permease protein
MAQRYAKRIQTELPPGLWPATAIYTFFFVFPLIYFLVISFWSVRARMMRPDFTFKNYTEVIVDYGDVLVYTLTVAALIAVVTTLLAFLFAYAIRFKLGRFANLFLFVALISLFGGYLVKIYAWKSILGTDGALNKTLLALGLVDEPVSFLLYSANGVVITLTYFLLPFAVLPIYGALRGIKDVTLEAARDLGAGPWTVIRDVVLPQCKGGLITAFTLSFLISAGDYVTPKFVGGGAALIGTFIENQFSVAFNWPLGAAMAFVTMLSALLVVLAGKLALDRSLRP